MAEKNALDMFFGDKPLYSDILLRQSQDALEKAYRGAESRVKGQIGAQAREGGAALRTTAIRGGYAGSPVEAALQRKLTADVTKTGADTMEQLESKKAAQETNLGLEMGKMRVQEQQARDAARQKLIASALGGVGGVLGELSTRIPSDFLKVEGIDTLDSLSPEDQMKFLFS